MAFHSHPLTRLREKVLGSLLLVFLVLQMAKQSANAFSIRPTRRHAIISSPLPRERHAQPSVIRMRLSASNGQNLERLSEDEAYCPLPAILPVFPLRKSVKLPTENLNLNLYEPRYQVMCDYILGKNDGSKIRVFGAIYGSDKPQVVKGGTGPIVPVYEPGDVGTLFVVEHAEEGIRPSTGGRRITIRGLAVGRFQIDSIWHDGYGGGEATTTNQEEALPFILVKPQRVYDGNSVSDGEKQRLLELEQHIKKHMREFSASSIFITQDNDNNDENQAEDNGNRNDEDRTGGVLADGTTTLARAGSANDVRVSAMDFLQETATDANIGSFRQQELFSMAAIVTLVPDRSPQDMKKVLQMTSTLERLEYLAQDLLKS